MPSSTAAGASSEKKQDGDLGDQPVRADHPLAQPLHLSEFYGLSGEEGGNQPVGAARLPQPDEDRAAEGPELPLHERHDEPGNRVGARSGDDLSARPALLHVLRPGATHAPHHVPKASIAKYKGKFDAGLRIPRGDAGPANQARGGPAGDEARPKPAAIKDWAALGRREEALQPPDGGLRRLRRVHQDNQPLIADALAELGQLENTLRFSTSSP